MSKVFQSSIFMFLVLLTSCDLATSLVKKELVESTREKNKPVVIESTPELEQVYDQAVALYQAGQFQKALDQVYEAIREDDTNMKFLYLKGACLYELGKYQESYIDMTYILDVAGPDPDVYNMIARIYYASGEFSETINVLKKTYDLDSTNLFALVSLSQVYIEMDKLGSAKFYYNKAVEIEPQVANDSLFQAIFFPDF